MSFLEELKKLPVPEDFGQYEDNGDLTYGTEDYVREIYRIAEKCGIQVSTDYGCTQFVIITSSKDVYKIPFRGMMYRNYKEDENGDTDWDNYEDELETYRVDHTARAEELYQKAEVARVEDIFSEVAFVGFSSNRYPIYQQEWACTYLDSEPEVSEESTTKANKMKEKTYIPFTAEWLAVAIQYFGEEYIEKVIKFIDTENIEDLHRNNYGFDKFGIPTIYDYSSFIESFVW